MTEDLSEKKILIRKLRSDLKIFPGGLDLHGHETWSVFDPVADRYSRINGNDYKLMMLLDKEQSIDEITERLKSSGGDADRDYIMKALHFLESSNLLVKPYGLDEKIARTAESIKSKIMANRLLNSYLFLNIPLVKPDPFFEKTLPYMKKIFSKWVLFSIILVSVYGYLSLLPKSSKIGSMFWNSINIEGILWYVIAVCLLKMIHECAHAYAAKFEGIRVRKMGIAFIVFIPRFYSDITDAWRLPERKKRCFIDAAGIFSEIVIGGFAAIVWNNTSPGVINSMAYSFFTVSVIATVFINGNPFIKYDGYFLLMDIVNIDNLYLRGVESVRTFCYKNFLGIKDPPRNFPGEIPGWRRYFIGIYAVASFFYRIFLYASIITIVYLKFTEVIGIALFALEVWLLILKPLINEIRTASKLKNSFNVKNTRITCVALCILIAILFLPLPWSIKLPCEVIPAEKQLIYAKSPGFLKELYVKDGANVKTGEDLMKLENPYLAWEGKSKEIDISMQEMYLDYVRSDKKQLEYAQMEKKRLDVLNNLLAENTRQQSLLRIKAAMDGIFATGDKHAKTGKWINEGEFLGEVFPPEKQIIAAYADESSVGRLKTGNRASVTVEGTLKKYYGTVTAVNPAPLKSVDGNTPLTDISGGTLVTVRNVDDGNLNFVFPQYIIHIKPDEGSDIPAGRTGNAYIRDYDSIALSAIKSIINTLRKEISF